MSAFLRKWVTLSFFNLLLVALLGFLMRYKIAFYLPLVLQKNVLNSHSHFAFAGWITQTLMVLLVHHLSLSKGETILKRYRWLLYANLVTAYGMLVTFLLQGYAFYSIGFSTLSLFVSYVFAVYFWRDLNGLKERRISSMWFKAALIFSVLSSLGAYSLAYMMAMKISYQNWHLASVYFFLHFQYNGWFFFAGMGLFVSKLETINGSHRSLKQIFWLFFLACIPAYFLSALWLPFPLFIYCLIITSVIAQLVGWILMIRFLKKYLTVIKGYFTGYGKTLLMLSAIAYSIKLLLQSCSVHPSLSHLSYEFRPIIIGYLHLVLLGVTSIFIIGFIVGLEMIAVTKSFVTGLVIFVSGVILNELLLMIQGVSGLDYIVIPHMDILLLGAAAVLFIGIGQMLKSLLLQKTKL